MKSTLLASGLAAALALGTVTASAQTMPTADLVPQMSTQDISSDVLGTSAGVIVPALTLLIIALILANGGSRSGPYDACRALISVC